MRRPAPQDPQTQESRETWVARQERLQDAEAEKRAAEEPRAGLPTGTPSVGGLASPTSGPSPCPQLQVLFDRLGNDMPAVIAPAATKLGQSGRAEAVPPLIRALRNEQRSVRFAVIEALVALHPFSRERLQEALEAERDLEFQHLLTLILGQLNRIAQGLEPIPTLRLLELLEKKGDGQTDC